MDNQKNLQSDLELQRFTLENGLRVLVTELPTTRSVTLLIYVRVGSRYEEASLSGMAHFVEHMLFKGTRSRPRPRDISDAIEGRGGAFNAGTGYETTSYYVKVAHEHFPVAVDVLSDMLLHSLFEPGEIEKERRVIIEEINETFDHPTDLVFYELDRLMWRDHPLGRDVAGSAETVGTLSRAQMLEFLAQHYGLENIVISVAGCVRAEQVVAQIRDAFAPLANIKHTTFQPFTNGQHAPRALIRYKKTEQAQIAVSLWGLPRNHPDRYVLRVLNTVLGDGMSSRLFQEIRERRGLAYDVSSFASALYECGVVGASASVEPKQAVATLQALLNEWDKLRLEPVSEHELTRAKEYLKGHILLGMEDTFSIASWYGRQEVYGAEMLNVDQVIERIQAVTASDIQRVAQQLFKSESLNLSVVGPFKSETRFLNALRLI
jgi:predicted Zn-dependent peptidase